MINKKKVDEFWKKRTKIKDPKIAIYFQHDDRHSFDLHTIKKYINVNSEILDLACGDCDISNALIDSVKSIKAVDKFGEFLKYCKKKSTLETVESDILDFTDTKKYDFILLMGVMHFFDEINREKLYKKSYNLLKKNGAVYIRHQCGVKEDIHIDNFSKKLGQHYYALYLSLKKELAMLKAIFSNVTVIDIFPEKHNLWSNTHYYAFICNK